MKELLPMKSKYPLASTTFGAEEIDAAKAVLDSNQFTMGERVRKFESEFAEWTGSKHAIMVNSGSSSNLLMVDLMLRRSKSAAPWKRGDEVLVPALSWPTTVWPLVQLGLVPVYVDVDPKTLAIDVESAKRALSPKTKGMFLIHVLGQCADMDAIQGFCRDHGLHLIEDNCESLGAHFKGRQAGTFGVTGSYSCFFSHHISTMEGGMITTNDVELYEDLKSLRAHGWVRDRADKAEWIAKHPELDSRFMFIMPGYNVRPLEVSAAIGSVQLKKLDSMLEARENLARDVHRWGTKYAPWMRLIGAEHLTEKNLSRRERRHSWMTFPFRLDPKAPVATKKVKELFEQAGVETRPIIAGNLARHPANRHGEFRQAESLANCDALLTQGFMIGCHPVLEAGAKDALESAFASLGKL
jgi:CDP-6-deoxy-D-xylo-4-hexulose-3-dehydrase